LKECPCYRHLQIQITKTKPTTTITSCYYSIKRWDTTDETNEVEIVSSKFNQHKILKFIDFTSHFKVSPYTFVDFLNVNGAVNERKQPSKNYPVGHYVEKEKLILVPKVGDYIMCPTTGFWRLATKMDVEEFDKKRKESLYIKFDTTPASKIEPNLHAVTESISHDKVSIDTSVAQKPSINHKCSIEEKETDVGKLTTEQPVISNEISGPDNKQSQADISHNITSKPKLSIDEIKYSIEKLAELRDIGLLTETEFNSKKQELLSRI